MDKEKNITNSYGKGLYYAIKEIADDAERIIEEYEKIKELSYSQQHKILFEKMERFVASHKS